MKYHELLFVYKILKLSCLFIKCIGVSILNSNKNNKKNVTTIATAEENCAALFCLLSHDLRNSLSSVITTSNYILESYSLLSEQKKISLLTHISDHSKELLERLENIFSMSKVLEHSLVFIDEPIETIIPLSIRRVRVKIPDFEIQVSLPPVLLVVSMDFVLIEHAFMLLFMNLWNHKNENDTLHCHVEEKGKEVVFHIHPTPITSYEEDFSPILSPEQNQKFDNTAYCDKDLSICELIINAHKGTLHTLTTQNIPSYIITLPLKENC